LRHAYDLDDEGDDYAVRAAVERRARRRDDRIDVADVACQDEAPRVDCEFVARPARRERDAVGVLQPEWRKAEFHEEPPVMLGGVARRVVD
jgi:hypothetical protein